MIALLLVSTALAQHLDLPDRVNVGEPLPVVVQHGEQPLRGVAVRGTWWPTADDALATRVGTTNSQGQVRWEPRRSGMLLVESEGQQTLVRVRPTSGKLPGLAVAALTLAGPLALLLWGITRVRRRVGPDRRPGSKERP